VGSGKAIHTFHRGEYKEATQESFRLIIDVGTNGDVYFLTAYPEDAMPPDAGRTAGDRDCCLMNRQADILHILEEGGTIRPELIGGETHYGGVSTHRT
jgi:hypothetical protein